MDSSKPERPVIYYSLIEDEDFDTGCGYQGGEEFRAFSVLRRAEVCPLDVTTGPCS